MIEVPAYPFDLEKAEIIYIDGIACYSYLSEEIYWQTVARLAAEINPADATIIFNRKGAEMVTYDLWMQWIKTHTHLGRASLNPVRYISSDSNETSGHVKEIVPITEKMVYGQHAIIIEDIGDSNNVMTVMGAKAREQGASSVRTATLTLKMNRPNQTLHEYNHVGVKIGNFWVGGWGMDYGSPNVPADFPRNSKVLVAKI